MSTRTVEGAYAVPRLIETGVEILNVPEPDWTMSVIVVVPVPEAFAKFGNRMGGKSDMTKTKT